MYGSRGFHSADQLAERERQHSDRESASDAGGRLHRLESAIRRANFRCGAGFPKT